MELIHDDSTRRDEQAAEWCIQLSEGRLAVEEQHVFDAWLAADPLNREAFNDAVAVWQGAEAAADEPEMLDIRMASLRSFRQAGRRRWSRNIFDRWRWPSAVAAALVLVVVTGLFFLRDPVLVYETGIGERQVAMLEDGSKVSLDAATKVEVRLHDDRRELRLLDGRAKFDVASDPLRPFSVAAGNKLIVATGTSFSVELVQQQMRVVLYEGDVKVLEKAAESSEPKRLRSTAAAVAADRALTPGRELVASISQPTVRVAAADLARSLSWEGGQLSFTNEPLALAVERMNRYSTEKLIVGDGAAARLPVNGVFIAGDTEAFVEGVSAVLPVTITRQPGQLTLKSN